MEFQNPKSDTNVLLLDIKCIYCTVPAIKKQLKLLSCLHVICDKYVKENTTKTEETKFITSGKMKYIILYLYCINNMII